MTKLITTKNIILLSLSLLILSILLFVPTDPDLFWRLKLGELTMHFGPVHIDTLSYTFYGQSFVDFEWATHWAIYFIYRIGGFYLLSIFFMIIVFITYYLPTSISPTRKPLIYRLGVIFMALIVTYTIIGIRPQMLTLFFFSILYFVIIKFVQTRNQKYLYIIPLIFLMWVNLHPGFLSGFLLIGLLFAAFVMSYFFKLLNRGEIVQRVLINRKELLLFISIAVLSLLITVINPYTYHIWDMIIENILDVYSQNNINEWLSPNFHTSSGKLMIFYIVTSVIVVFKSKRLNIFQLLLTLAFGIMAFTSVRHFPLFVIVTINSWLEISVDYKMKHIMNMAELRYLSYLLLLSSLLIFLVKAGTFININKDENSVYNYNNYPVEAVNYLRSKNISGKIFNDYRWGGFLSWEYDENKVFISGLMPSWRNDGEPFLRTYRNISYLSSNDWQDQLDNYDVEVLILRKDSALTNAARYSEYWDLIYEDENCVVYKRKK